MSNRTILTILFILVVHFFFTQVFEWYFSRPPLSESITLSQDNESVYEIHIPMEQTYDIEIGFAKENFPFEYLDKKIGSITRDSKGLPLTLEWQFLQNNEVIEKQIIRSTEACGWAADYIYRCFGRIQFKPGSYFFSIKTLEIHPDLAEFKTNIYITYNFKNAHTWQTAYIFWAQIFNTLVAPIVVLIIVVILILNNYKHLTSRFTRTHGSGLANCPILWYG